MTKPAVFPIPYLRLWWASVFGVFLTLAMFSSSMAQTPDLYLEVRDLKVEFIAPKKIRVSGSVRGRGLRHLPKDDPASGVDIAAHVDFIRDDADVITGTKLPQVHELFLAPDASYRVMGAAYYEKVVRPCENNLPDARGPSRSSRPLSTAKDWQQAFCQNDWL